MGLLSRLFGKKPSGGLPSDGQRREMLGAAAKAAAATTGPEARQAMAEMAAVLERAAVVHEPTRVVAARVRQTVSMMDGMEDEGALKTCHLLAEGMTESARRIEAARAIMSGR